MVTLALDSSTLIEVMRGRDPAVRRFHSQAGEGAVDLVAPVVVLHELLSGADVGRNRTAERGKVERVLRGVAIVSLEVSDIESTAAVRARLKATGRSIGDIDTLIAGQALARGWTVVTRNVRSFGRVDGLPLVDWSIGADPLSVEAIAARVREVE